MTVFLAQLFGIYFIVIGVLVLVRRKSLMPAVQEIVKSRPLMFVIGALELLAGTAIVLAYTTVSASVEGLISLIGYTIVIEGLVYLALPIRFVQKIVRSHSQKFWYQAGGIIAVLGGVYLAGNGFGFF